MPCRPQRPAYFTPEVDSSDEPFTWGFPDLERLRRLLSGELGWSISKVDDEVLPIVHRIARRSNGIFANTTQQGSLDSFFDMSGGGTAVFAPKVRQANPSKRLQAVVQRFREIVAARAGEQAPAKPLFFQNDASSDSGSASDNSDVLVVEPKKRTKGRAAPAARGGRGAKAARGSARGRGRGRGGGARSSAATSTHTADTNDDEDGLPPSPLPKRKRAPARKKADRAPTPEPEDSDDGQASFGEEEGDAEPVAPARPQPRPKPRTRKASTPASDGDYVEA
jgi:DNA excision repair protein ERCC-5